MSRPIRTRQKRQAATNAAFSLFAAVSSLMTVPIMLVLAIITRPIAHDSPKLMHLFGLLMIILNMGGLSLGIASMVTWRASRGPIPLATGIFGTVICGVFMITMGVFAASDPRTKATAEDRISDPNSPSPLNRNASDMDVQQAEKVAARNDQLRDSLRKTVPRADSTPPKPTLPAPAMQPRIPALAPRVPQPGLPQFPAFEARSSRNVNREILPAAGQAVGREFRQERFGKPIIGFIHRAGDSKGKSAMIGVTALFTDEDTTFGQSVTKARPGYLVAGINVEADTMVTAFQVVFMRQLDDDRLDVNDHYESEWIGFPKGSNVQKLGQDGRVVIGFHGYRGDAMHSMGLVVNKAEVAAQPTP